MGASIKGAMFGGIGAELAYGIGHGFGAEWSLGLQSLAHGVTQGAIAHLRGGDFRSGFIGGHGPIML